MINRPLSLFCVWILGDYKDADKVRKNHTSFLKLEVVESLRASMGEVAEGSAVEGVEVREGDRRGQGTQSRGLLGK